MSSPEQMHKTYRNSINDCYQYHDVDGYVDACSLKQRMPQLRGIEPDLVHLFDELKALDTKRRIKLCSRYRTSCLLSLGCGVEEDDEVELSYFLV